MFFFGLEILFLKNRGSGKWLWVGSREVFFISMITGGRVILDDPSN